MEFDHLRKTETYKKTLTILIGLDNENMDEALNMAKSVTEVESSLGEMVSLLNEKKSIIADLKEQMKILTRFDQYLNEIDQQFPEELCDNEDQENCDATETSCEFRTVGDFSVSTSTHNTQKPANGGSDVLANKGNQQLTNAFPSIRHVTEREFSTVHKYMRGRHTVQSINSMVDVINEVLKKKYSILKAAKAPVDKRDRDLYHSWKIQERKCGIKPGSSYYCTVADLNRLEGFKMDKASFNTIVILRHLKRIKETRCENELLYLVN